MYIHNYQIHNVLNVYRKQLSQSPGLSTPKQPAPASDRVEISGNGQRQSLIDQVSAQIVESLAKNGPDNHFERPLNEASEKAALQRNHRAKRKDAEFTFTAIDENNCKSINTMPVDKLSPLIDR